MSLYSSPLEVGCRKTSPFGSRWGTTHAGTDYAPPKAGQVGVPVLAIYDGVVVKSDYGTGLWNASVLPWHSGNAVLIDHGIIGGDRVETYYGHMALNLVKVGERVTRGQQIGIMGSTGNSIGIHLHLGVRLNRKTMIDPDAWLRRKGIVVGTTPPNVYSVPLVPAGSVTPLKPSSNTSVSANEKKNNITIQKAMRNGGYYPATALIDGINGPMQKAAVKAYQADQKIYKLTADGIWGPKTRAHYLWTKKLQNALNGWKSTAGTSVPVDGSLDAFTVARIRDIQYRNRNGKYIGAVDGVPGRVFCKMLGIPTHP